MLTDLTAFALVETNMLSFLNWNGTKFSSGKNLWSKYSIYRYC